MDPSNVCPTLLVFPPFFHLSRFLCSVVWAKALNGSRYIDVDVLGLGAVGGRACYTAVSAIFDVTVL